MNLYHLLLIEIKNLHKIHGVTRNIVTMAITTVTCFPMILPTNQITNLAPIIFAIIFTIVLPNMLVSIAKKEFEEGYLEWLLTVLSPEKIVITKFLSVTILVMVSLTPLWILSSIFFNYSLYSFMIFFVATIFLILQVNVLGMFCFSIQAYFYSNTQFILSVILPLLLPHLIIFGMIISKISLKLLFLGAGITLFSIPVYIVMAIYLIKNTYNF